MAVPFTELRALQSSVLRLLQLTSNGVMHHPATPVPPQASAVSTEDIALLPQHSGLPCISSTASPAHASARSRCLLNFRPVVTPTESSGATPRSLRPNPEPADRAADHLCLWKGGPFILP